MRPTVSEQLDGLRRILADVVVPELHDPYPADILAGVMAALDALGRAWYELPRYLHWDIRASTDLLTAALPLLPGDLAAAVDQALTGDSDGDLTGNNWGDPFDLAGLEGRHQRVRSALALVSPAILTDPDLQEVRAQMLDLFRERTGRFPFALAPRTAIPPHAIPPHATAVSDEGKRC